MTEIRVVAAVACQYQEANLTLWDLAGVYRLIVRADEIRGELEWFSTVHREIAARGHDSWLSVR